MRKKRQYYVVRPLQCNYPNIPRLHWRRSTCPSVHHNTMGLIKQPGNLPCSDLYTHGCTFHMHTLLNEKRMFKHDRRICLASKFINKSSHMYIVKLIYNIYQKFSLFSINFLISCIIYEKDKLLYIRIYVQDWRSNCGENRDKSFECTNISLIPHH